jgi:thiamine-phosphate pyrophosphorylase
MPKSCLIIDCLDPALLSKVEAIAARPDLPAAVILLNSDQTAEKTLKTLIAQLQSSQIAVLTDGPHQLPQRTGADGLYAPLKNLTLDTLKALKPRYMVVAGDVTTRDEAMIAGEMEVDAILMGLPAKALAGKPTPDMLDLATWWTPLAQIPCIALASNESNLKALESTDVEFIGSIA